MATKFDFNKGLNKLEDIVKTMESGDLSLEDSLKYFEQGYNALPRLNYLDWIKLCLSID
jgi:exodeoxyribonuclease VII small subunit